MKVSVDPEKCQGHSLCALIAPSLFVLSDVDGHATAIVGEVPIDQEQAGREAAGTCPEQAIVIAE